MKTLLKYWWQLLLAIAVILAIGFFVGRSTIKPSTKIEYVKGDPIHDSIPIPEPYNVYIPADPVLPTKPDTIKLPGGIEYRVLKVDTAKIISEYISRNRYKITLFDNNENGKLIVNPVVQYNKLDSLGYEFTPINKVITNTTEKTITPFINASYNSFGYFGAGGGIYYHNLGLGAKYMTDFKDNGFEVSIHYKL